MVNKMPEEKEDQFALLKPNGLPAYPKMIHRPVASGDKNKDGTDVMDGGTLVKNPEEHKKLLSSGDDDSDYEPKSKAKVPEWGKK